MLIAIRHAACVQRIVDAAPTVRPLFRAEEIVVPSPAMLAILMLAVREDNQSTSEAIERAYGDTRRRSGSPGPLTSPFNLRQRKLRQYLDTGVPLTKKFATELLEGLSSIGTDRVELWELLTGAPRQVDAFHHFAGLDARRRIQVAVEAELAAPMAGRVLRDILAAAADQLDSAPAYYPRSLAPTVLADSMTITQLASNWLSARDDDAFQTALYGGLSSTDGAEAVRTLSEQYRSVVLGDPGSGKSTILAAFVASRIRDDPSRLTLFARLPDVAALAVSALPRSTGDAVGLVVDAFAAWFDGIVSEDFAANLIDMLQNSRDVVIALDAWDEVYDAPEREATLKTLRHLDNIAGRIVITSRVTGYERPLPEVSEFLTDRLAPDQADAFFDAWFDDPTSAGAERVRAARRSSEEIRELVTIPLMAGLVAFVGQSESVPTRKHLLFQRSIAMFLERRWRPLGEQRIDPVTIANLEDVATNIAWRMATASNRRSPIGEWHDTATVADLLRMAPAGSDQVSELISRDGLLTLHGRPDPGIPKTEHRFRWLHRTIHEHLAGRMLSSIAGQEFEQAAAFIRSAVLRPDWQVALEHAVGLIDAERQADVLDDLDEFAGRGDPGGYVRAAIDGLTVACDPTLARFQATLRRALDQGHYGLAYQLDAPRTLEFICTSPPQDVTWGTATNLIAHVFGDTPLELDFLEALVIRGSAPYQSSRAARLLANRDQSRADRVIREALRSGRGLFVDLPCASPQVIAEAKERLSSLRKGPLWLDMLRALACTSPELEQELLLALDPPLADVMRVVLHDQNDSIAIASEPKEAVDPVLRGDYGPWAAAVAGGQVDRSIDDRPDASVWARLGFWYRETIRATNSSSPYLDAREPAGEWNIERALTTLDGCLDRLQGPADPGTAVEVNRAQCWLINHPTVDCLSAVAQIEAALRACWSEPPPEVWEDEPLAEMIATISPKLMPKLAWPDVWSSAQKRLGGNGWEMVRLFLRYSPDDSDADWRIEAVGDIVHAMSAHSANPRLDEYFRFAPRLTAGELEPLLTVAESTTDLPTRAAIVGFIAGLLSPTSLESEWARLTRALNPR